MVSKRRAPGNGGRAVDKVARAPSPASWPGVPPCDDARCCGAMPLELTDEDAHAILCHWPWRCVGLLTLLEDAVLREYGSSVADLAGMG